MTTLFEKIIRGEISSEKVYENDHLIAIKDIHPVAPVHLLLIPKKPIPSLQDMKEEDFFLLPEIVRVAQELAVKFQIENGYRLVVNCGTPAGQTIFHLHFHLIGGKPLVGMA